MAEHTLHHCGDHSSTEALPPWWTADTVAVVTGANRGIGYEIVRKLAVEGMTVVLTARDEGRGLKAAENLHAEDLKNVVFHQLDVANPDSVTEFAKWLKETHNGLDILVNNAGIYSLNHAYDKALEGMNVNYFGTMNLTEKLLPLFKESIGGARIINLSSLGGFLANVKDEKLRQQLSNPCTFDQAFLNTVAGCYLSASQSCSEDVYQYGISSYYLSKTLLNAYTRLLAQSYPTFSINCVHPGLVETEMLHGYIKHVTPEVFGKQLENRVLGKDGVVGVGEGADTTVWLAVRRLLPEVNVASGLFWYKRAVLSFHSWDQSNN